MSREHTETLAGHEIVPVVTKGVMEVYERVHYRKEGLPKYVVFHKDGRALEEFRGIRGALKWAEKNKGG